MLCLILIYLAKRNIKNQLSVVMILKATDIVFKLALPVILGFIFWRLRYRSRRFVTFGLGVVLGTYLVVIGFHVRWVVNLAGWFILCDLIDSALATI